MPLEIHHVVLFLLLRIPFFPQDILNSQLPDAKRKFNLRLFIALFINEETKSENKHVKSESTIKPTEATYSVF